MIEGVSARAYCEVKEIAVGDIDAHVLFLRILYIDMFVCSEHSRNADFQSFLFFSGDLDLDLMWV